MSRLWHLLFGDRRKNDYRDYPLADFKAACDCPGCRGRRLAQRKRRATDA